MDVASHALKEPQIATVRQYRWRVRGLAAIFLLIVTIALIADALILWKARYLVTLAQRTNVETLTLAFFFLFFTYLLTLSLPGAWGSLQLVYFKGMSRFRGALAAERLKSERLGPPLGGRPPTVGLNCAIELEGQSHQTLEIAIRDEAGSMGTIRFDGVRVEHIEARRDGTPSLFAFLVVRLNEILKLHGTTNELDIIEWNSIDDEETEKYLRLASFARRLERALKTEPLWTTLTLTPAQVAELERQLSELCPILRNEAFLPHLEYSGEHKLPIIPEPLGIISLSRAEKRVDPLASLGASLITLVIASGLLTWIIFFPPWVPGT